MGPFCESLPGPNSFKAENCPKAGCKKKKYSCFSCEVLVAVLTKEGGEFFVVGSGLVNNKAVQSS